MRQTISRYIDNAIAVLLLIIAGVTPLLFLGQTTEFYEMPKLIFLIVTTLLLAGLWIFSWIVKGKVAITRTPLDISLLVLLVAVAVSTYFSTSRFPAIYGDFPRVNGSAVSWVVYILLYFVTVSQLKTIGKIKNLLYVLYGSGVVVTLITLLSFFHLYLPMDFAKVANFTPTGSSFATIAFLLLLLPLPVFSLLKENKFMPLPLAEALSILFSVTVVLIGSLPTYIVLLAIYAVCALTAKIHTVRRALPMFALPLLATALAFVLAYLPMGSANKIQVLEANFPKEVQLPFSMSWKVSASAFRDAPFTGTGPSTYLFNFTNYKPLEFNATNLWNFSFDTAHDEYLEVLGTLGVLGVLGIILFCLVVLTTSRRYLSFNSPEAEQDDTHVLLPSLAVSALVTVVLLGLHATTLVSVVVSLLLLAALMMSQRSVREKVMELSMGIKASTSEGNHFDLFPVIIFIVFLVAAVPALYQTYTATAADVYHRQALIQANQNGTLTYQDLQKAETLNPYVDLYRVDMAQTNFALANALAAKKGPTQANPQGSLTDQDKQTIQTLLSQSINEGRVSVTLSPLSSRNWEVLASIYRNISGVAQNALAFSLDAYGRAIQLDPLNPALRVNVGGIYYSAKNYSLATRYFTDAANLKPDYANAYYNLAITLRDSNDPTNAALVAQQLVNLLAKDTKSTDYQTANSLLSDLKAQLAKTQQSGQSGQEQAPAAQNNSALQNVSGVNVNNLNNPPQVSPAPAVKANPNANIPQVTPAPTKAQ